MTKAEAKLLSVEAGQSKISLAAVSAAGIVVLALALRLYQIKQLLWLDEIVAFGLGKGGLDVILQNSWGDPHPPLFYFVQWALTGFGRIQNEIYWHLPVAMVGAAAVLVMMMTSRKIGSNLGGFATGIIAATSPFLIYYSQEARPYSFSLLIASCSTWLVLEILEDSSHHWLWIAWIVSSLLGIHFGYAYAMVIGVQAPFLGYYFYKRKAWQVGIGLILLGTAPVLPFAFKSLSNAASKHEQSDPLTFWHTLQALFAGEPLRYGYSLAHTYFPWFVLALTLVGVVFAVQRRDKRLIYGLLQAVLPMGLFFGISPLIGIRLPLTEAKQFIVLWPAFITIIAVALVAIRNWLAQNHWQDTPLAGILLPGIITGLLVTFNAAGLRSYWNTIKSPEGAAIQFMLTQKKPDDGVVSLHYSLNFGLAFYGSETSVYYDPILEDGVLRFRLSPANEILAQQSRLPMESTEDIRRHQRFWIAVHTHDYREALEPLTAGCQIAQRRRFMVRDTGFETWLVKCRNAAVGLPIDSGE